MPEPKLIDDGSSQLVVVDDEEIALWVRVGPVYGADIDRAVWVEYQPEYMGSSLSGPVMIPIDIWRKLVDAVNARIENK